MNNVFFKLLAYSCVGVLMSAGTENTFGADKQAAADFWKSTAGQACLDGMQRKMTTFQFGIVKKHIGEGRQGKPSDKEFEYFTDGKKITDFDEEYLRVMGKEKPRSLGGTPKAESGEVTVQNEIGSPAQLADKAGDAMNMYFAKGRGEAYLKDYISQATLLEHALMDSKLKGVRWDSGRELEMSAYVIWNTFHIVHKSEKFLRFGGLFAADDAKKADRLAKSIRSTAESIGAWPSKVEADCIDLLKNPKSTTGAQQGRVESIIAEISKIDEGNAKNMRAAYKI